MDMKELTPVASAVARTRGVSSVWELRVRTSGSLVRAMVSSQARVSARMVALDDVSFMTALLTADTFLLLGLLHGNSTLQ